MAPKRFMSIHGQMRFEAPYPYRGFVEYGPYAMSPSGIKEYGTSIFRNYLDPSLIKDRHIVGFWTNFFYDFREQVRIVIDVSKTIIIEDYDV